MRGYLSALFLCLAACSAAVCASAYTNEPSGFMGMSWGSDFSLDPYLRFYQTEGEIGVLAGKNVVEPLSAYSKKNDDLLLGLAELSAVYYYYWCGKFFGISAATRSAKTKDALKAVCFERFGPPDRSENFVMPGVRHTWAGYSAMVHL